MYGDQHLGGTDGIGGLNALFIMTDEPEVYNLPANPQLPQDRALPAFATTALAAIGLGVTAYLSMRSKG